MLSCDETGLFLKKLPNRTYITKEKKSMPGHKCIRHRITILVCANASGDCKIKPMVIYHSENPRILERNKVMKCKLTYMMAIKPYVLVYQAIFCRVVEILRGSSLMTVFSLMKLCPLEKVWDSMWKVKTFMNV